MRPRANDALPMSTWQPTIAHLRASVGGLLLAVAAILLRRPDLLVLGCPLLVIAGWSVWARPARDPLVVERLDHATLREGEATRWRVEMHADPGTVEDVTAVLASPPFSELDPVGGAITATVDERGDSSLAIALRSTRWGRRTVGPARVVATSAWAAFRWTSFGATPRRLVTLPLPAVFDTTAPVAHPVGLVGTHRSARPGDGSEFASVRAFQTGDKLRRIHWPRSMRTGVLHVTSTWSDQDSHVVLLVDAWNDIGESGGIDGRASSLDTAVRAAGAIAEHHLHRGDRVSMHVLGARGVFRVPPAAGTGHLRRVLDTLSAVEPGTDQREETRMHLGLAAGSLVVMFSPLVSPLALQRAVTLARRGLTVVVVDTLPAGIVGDDGEDPIQALAWRIRLLERRREIRRVQEAGVPVVAWRGPGSLDPVLRDLHRRAGAPRVVRR